MLKPRIHGTEMEYSAFIQPAAGCEESVAPEAIVSDVLNFYMPAGLEGLNSFYSNGSRMYVDIGEHPEYATPEDTSFMGTVANEIAGERLLHASFSAAQEEDEFSAFVLNKRVIDSNGRTWGYHENYLVDAKEIEINEGHLALLGVHLATRNIFCGAGAVFSLGAGGRQYMISQKNTRLTQDFHLSTTHSSKPLVNLRDEAHADRNHWRRVHVTSGDANMSPWATLMKLGTSSMVLRLTEHEIELPWLADNRLCQIATEVAKDTSLTNRLTLSDGKKVTAAEIQTELCDSVTRLSEEVELPPEEQKILAMWQTACDLARNDPDQLAEKTDWGAKLQFMERYQDKHGLSWQSRSMVELDWRYDRLSPSGLGYKLREGRWADDMPTNELISWRMFNPPQSTRAKLRAEFVTKAMRHSGTRLVNVNWAQVSICDTNVKLNNPYMTKDERFKRLLSEMDRLRVFTR